MEIIPIVNKYYRKKRDSRKLDKLHVSDSYRCDRQIYFKYRDEFVPEEFDAKTLRIFDNGDYFHWRMMSVFYSSPDIEIISSEGNIQINPLLSGRYDTIISDGEENYVVDFKSASDWSFGRNKKEGKEAHITQINLYMHFLDNVNKGKLIYENKNNQEMSEVDVEYDREKALKDIERLEKIKGKIDRGIIPKIPEDIDAWDEWQCGICRYRKICKRIGKRKELLQENVPELNNMKEVK